MKVEFRGVHPLEDDEGRLHDRHRGSTVPCAVRPQARAQRIARMEGTQPGGHSPERPLGEWRCPEVPVPGTSAYPPELQLEGEVLMGHVKSEGLSANLHFFSEDFVFYHYLCKKHLVL